MNRATISQDSLNAAVWAACDTFRGTVDPSIYKDYVLTMLFLKYVSDTWQDRHDSYREQYANAEPALVEELLKTERFVLPASASFRVLHAARFEPGNGERIDKALQAIEDANLSKLRDVFQDISFNASKLGDEQQKNELLRHLLESFAKPELDLRPSRVGTIDIVGNAYEYLIKQFASSSGKKAGDFYMPPEISDLMVRLTDPQGGEEICDPTCGSGSLLLKCSRHVRERTGTRRYALYGQEAIGSTWALAKMNMFLHGEDNHRIEWGDVIRNPRLVAGEASLRQFDVVVANPPFSLETWGIESAGTDRFARFRRGVPPRTKGDFAFILHMVETMKADTGRMAVVVPHGVLFRGAAEGRIRQKLVEENLLDAVIGVPEKLFYGTGIPAVILVLRRNRKDDKVVCIDASRNFQPGKSQNLLREMDLQRIVAACAARRSVNSYARLVDFAEIAGQAFNLNISRYIDSDKAAESVDFVELRREQMEIRKEWRGVEEKMAAYLKELGYE